MLIEERSLLDRDAPEERDESYERLVLERCFDRLLSTAAERWLFEERPEVARFGSVRPADERLDEARESERLDDRNDSVRRLERLLADRTSAASRPRDSARAGALPLTVRLLDRLPARSVALMRSRERAARLELRSSARLPAVADLSPERLALRSSATRSPRELDRSLRSKSIRELRLLCAHSRCSARATVRSRVAAWRAEAGRSLFTKRVCSTRPR